MTTIAFAGDAPISLENVKALMNDYLGIVKEDDDGYPEIPDNVNVYYVFPHSIMGGMESMFDYGEYLDLPYYVIYDVEVSKDGPTKSAIEQAEASTPMLSGKVGPEIASILTSIDDGVLVIAWGEDDRQNNESWEKVVAACQDRGVRVLDITSGLDDLQLSSEAPQINEEKTPRKGSEELTEDEQELTEPQDEAQQQAPDHLRVDTTYQQGEGAPEAQPEPVDPSDLLISVLLDNLYPAIRRKLIADGFVMNPVIGDQGDSVSTDATPVNIEEGETVVPPKKKRGRPRKDGL